MNKNILYLALALLFSQSIFAQNAYIAIDSVNAAIPGYKQKVERINEKVKAYQAEITTAKKETQNKLNKLLGSYSPQANETFDQIKKRMKETDVIQLDILLEDDKATTKKEQSYGSIITLDYNDTILPDVQKLNAIISKYAEEKKLEAVYILEQLKPALQYVNPTKVITNDIIQLILKEYKVK